MSTRTHPLRSTSPPRSVARRRGGAVTIELLVALPVLLIVVLAVSQFGFYFQRVQQLIQASRMGAEEASQTASLPTSGLVPATIANAINQQLANANISTAVIIVEQNVLGTKQDLRTDFVANSLPVPVASLPLASVRVTVGVPLSDLMPNCLAAFGFDISNRYAVYTTTFGYEL